MFGDMETYEHLKVSIRHAGNLVKSVAAIDFVRPAASLQVGNSMALLSDGCCIGVRDR